MTNMRVQKTVKAFELTEGAGVTVHRTIGTPSLKNLDPFLMLDHFSSDNPDDYIAGFPDHPHRGFITLTYMIDGHMEHRDSMGNHGDLRSGAAQWMKAASGVIHSEMPKQTNGLMRGFQLWINLPAAEKMSEPAYQEYPPESMPVDDGEGYRVKVLLGEFAGKKSPIVDPISETEYLDVSLQREQHFIHSVPPTKQSFIYVFEGSASIEQVNLPQHTFAVLSSGDQLDMESGTQGARFILVSGKPINEPVVQYGPFVMNSESEIRQAMRDYQNGSLVKRKAAFITD